jgi:hypothetical protein
MGFARLTLVWIELSKQKVNAKFNIRNCKCNRKNMEYAKEFLKEFKVDTGQTYIVVPVDGKLHEVPLSRKNTNKKYFAMVQAEESSIRGFQCSAIECDFKHLDDCIGCRCLPGGRKDNKAVVFKIEYIYQKY